MQQSFYPSRGLFYKIGSLYSNYATWLVVPALIAGIFGHKFFPNVVGKTSDYIIGNFIEGILVLAPFAIFVVLAPSVAKMLKARKESAFGGFVVGWFSVTRVLAAIWAAIFVFLVLGLSVSGEGSVASVGELISQTMGLLAKQFKESAVFWSSMVGAILLGILAYFVAPLYRLLEKGYKGIETLGDYLEPVIPVLVFMIGSYIYGLPDAVRGELASGLGEANVGSVLSKDVGILGVHFDLTTEWGIVGVYFLKSLIIGMGCFIWQLVWIGITKLYVKEFNIKEFFTKYWFRVYPLAWSTASEALSMPLNIAIIKKTYSHISDMVRKFVVGLGAYLNVNGTTMDILVLAGVCSICVGHPATLVSLLAAIPIIVFIGYAVPGIPGEAVLFATPVMALIGIPPEAQPAFFAIFVAIQLGLPDSFRTGANVTDNGLFAILLDKVYKKHFVQKDKTIEEPKKKAA